MAPLRKIFFPFALIALSALRMDAVKASPESFDYRQPDGSYIAVRLIGDEYCHYYIDTKGRRLLPDDKGCLREASDTMIASRRERPLHSSASTSSYPTIGRPKALVLLVEFPDCEFRFGQEQFDRMMNLPGYSDFGSTGSARDYYIENSHGLFSPEFDVYGPVKVAHERAYYSAGDDALAHEMVTDALRLLDPEVDFSEYDMDRDGWIDNVYVFYAGHGRADGGGYNTIWPHTANVYAKGARLTVDGVMAGAYSCSNELQGGSSSMVGIGTFAHEFGHVLGLPDLYATNGMDVPSPGLWSIMDHGNYNNNGRTPVNFSAYEKLFLGWCEPIEITADASLRIEPLIGMAYKVSVPDNPDEYFLLECRDKSGWDAYLPGNGMIVWHIDYDKTAWDTNGVNNDPDRQRVDLIEADGLHSSNGDAGDAFPGTRSVTSLSLTSAEGNTLSPSFSRISLNDDAVTLEAGNGSDMPVAPAKPYISDIKDARFTINRDAVSDLDAWYVTVCSSENGRIRPVPGWQLRKVEGNSVQVFGLNPETTYSVCARACNGISIGPASENISVTTDKPGLSFFAPEMLEAENISDNSFTARWNLMELADSYLLTVTTTEQGEARLSTATFSTDAPLPDGWTANSAETISISGYYGEAAPAMRMKESGTFLETSISDEPLTAFSFWMRGYRTDSDARIAVKALKNGAWSIIDEIIPDRTEGHIYTYEPADASAMRLEWSDPNESGSACIDDVTLALAGEMQQVTVLDTDTGLQSYYDVTGLEPGKTYMYSVRGTDGEDISLPGRAIEVTTLAGPSEVSEIRNPGFSAICREGTLYVSAPGLTITILDIAGTVIGSGQNRMTIHLPKGIYIIKAGDRTIKAIR